MTTNLTFMTFFVLTLSGFCVHLLSQYKLHYWKLSNLDAIKPIFNHNDCNGCGLRDATQKKSSSEN